MEILILVVVVVCILLALIPRYIAVRGRTEAPPKAAPRPSPLAPTGPAAASSTATVEAPARIGDRIGKTRERLAGAVRSLRSRSTLDGTV